MATGKLKIKKYDFSKIERKWQKIWASQKTHQPNLDGSENPFYNLMMFPYPSAEGLHAGNMYAFTGADMYGRFQRMNGKDVFEPIGLDGFGIHSENYALKIGTHPLRLSKISEKRYYKQLKSIGNSYAWDSKVETYDPEYYKWTQWLFLQLYKKGLAYKKKASVNWCPKCLTVLADEQVIGGECERCGSKVEKKELEQWFFKITDYAEKLLSNLEDLDWSERVKIAQRNWIGKSSGLVFSSPVKDTDLVIETFSAHFEAYCADTFVAIAPDHYLLPKLLDGVQNRDAILKKVADMLKKRGDQGYSTTNEVEGVFTGRYIIDPVGNGELPIWIASYALADYGTGIVKCSAHDERDFAFAKKYGIKLKPVLFPEDPEQKKKVMNLEYCFSDMTSGILSEPLEFSGRVAGEIREAIADYAVAKGLAKRETKFKLRDWLISRQRYWGPPIPIIYCDKCGTVPVPEKDLPVKLPNVKDFRPTGTGHSPLASVKSFVNVNCPVCKAPAQRETDVSDTFLDSAWYFFRYLDNENKNEPFSKLRASKWLPVDMYIGGAEHSVLHLLYTRFITMVMNDIGLIDFEEPFKKFRAHGLIIKDGAKMSKSKGNVINPDEYIKRFGSDVLRTYLMFLAPFEQGGDFQAGGIVGVVRFLERVWRLGSRINNQESKISNDVNTQKLLHKTIKKVTKDIENLSYNTAISSLMILLNALEKEDSASKQTFESFIKLLNPFAPHISHELWSGLGNKSVLDQEEWPKFDKNKLEEHIVKIAIQVNGKTRAVLEMEATSDDGAIESEAKNTPDIKKWLEGKSVKKVIHVKGKIINFVV